MSGFDSSRLRDYASGQVASVGRIVHYVPHGTPVREDGTQAFPSGQCRAAIVSEVGFLDEAETKLVVGLVVLNPSGMFFHAIADGGCVYDELHGPGTWHWPERV